MVPDPVAPAAETPEVRGLAHVGAVSFLASRLVPGGPFWFALAGGVALARAGARHGARTGYGASIAAMVETVALIGPARVNGPLTQALNAPVVGSLYARGAGRRTQFAAALVIRLLHYVVLNVLVVWLVVGGLDTFVDTYDKLVGWLGLPTGTEWAVGVTVVASLGWGCFYSAVQVLVYGRSLRRWDEAAAAAPRPPDQPVEAEPYTRPRVPPGALVVVFIGLAATAALIAFLSWLVVAGVSAALVVGWLGWRVRDRDALRLGLLLGLMLGFGAVFPVILGVVDVDLGLQRAARAVLIVLVATWARAAVGTEGVRAVAAAALWRLRRLPSAAEGSRLVVAIASDERLGDAARELGDALRDVPHEPLPVADAVTAWVIAEADRAVAVRPPAAAA